MPLPPLEGEIVNHPQPKNRIFKTPGGTLNPLWSGCLAPILVICLFIYLIYQGATSQIGIELVRGFIIFIVVFLLLQLFIGGGLFKKSSLGLKATLLTNLGVILLLMMLAIIGLATLIQQVL